MFIKNKKDKESNKEFPVKNEAGIGFENLEEQAPLGQESQELKIEQDTGSQKEKIAEQKKELQESDKQKIEELKSVGVSSQTLASDEGLIEKFNAKEVEKILQEGLEDTYRKMDPVSQAQFKAQGEDTARAISLLMQKAKIKVREIVDLIVKWLKLIPGVNKFFVEQEAKIKADKLMEEKRRGDANE